MLRWMWWVRTGVWIRVDVGVDVRLAVDADGHVYLGDMPFVTRVSFPLFEFQHVQ